MLLYFDVGGRRIVFILYLVIFSLRYLTTWDVERRLLIGYLSSRIRFMGTPPQVLTISKQNPNRWNFLLMHYFFHRTHISHKTRFKSILVATVLGFHGSFLEVIGNEPSGKYKDPTRNHFHHTIISILSDTNIPKKTFQKWQDEVIAGFNEKDWLDVAIFPQNAH